MKRLILLISMLLLSVLCTYSQQAPVFTWDNYNPTFVPALNNTNIHAVKFSNKNNGVIACDGCKLYYSNDGGHYWELGANPLLENPSGRTPPKFTDLAYCTDNIFIAVGEKGTALRSKDGGATWEKVKTNFSKAYDLVSVEAKNNIVIIVGEKSNYVSTNYGYSWTEMIEHTQGEDNNNINNDTTLIVIKNKAYISTDGGESWQIKNFETDGKLVFKDADNGIAIDYWRRIYITNNGGENWGQVAFLRDGANINNIIFKGKSALITGGRGSIFASKNGGHSWTEYNKEGYSGDFNDIEFVEENKAIAVGTRGGIFLMTINDINDDQSNHTLVWCPIKDKRNNIGPRGNLLSIFFINENKAFATGYKNEIYKTENAGEKWEVVRHPLRNDWTNYSLSDVKFKNEKDGFVAFGGGKALKTTDGGITWDTISTNTRSHLNTIAISENVTIMAGAGGTIVRIDNETNTITSTSGNTLNSADIMGSCVIGNTIFLCGNNRTILKSNDNGVSWVPSNNGIDDARCSINDIFFRNANEGYAVSSKGKVYKTVDGGNLWEALPSLNNVQNASLNAIEFRGNNGVIVGSHSKTWITTDGGTLWKYCGYVDRYGSFYDVQFNSDNTAYGVGGEMGVSKLTIGKTLPPAELSVSNTLMTFDHTPNEYISVPISSNLKWEANISDDWIKVSPKSGTNNGEIKIITSINNGSETRTGRVTISGRGITKTITVRQEAAPSYIRVTPEIVNFDAIAISQSGEQSQRVIINSNHSWVATKNVDWLTISPESGDNNANELVIKTTSNNEFSVERTGKIKIRAGNIEKEITVTHSGHNPNYTPIPHSITWLYLSHKIKGIKISDNSFTSVSCPRDNYIYVGGNNSKVIKSTNGGDSFIDIINNPFYDYVWTNTSSWSDPENNSYIENVNDIAFTDTLTGYCAGQFGNIMRTKDGGKTWTMVNPKPFDISLYAVAAYGNTVIASGNNIEVNNTKFNLIRSVDGGKTWKRIKCPNIGSNSINDIQFVNANLVYACGNSGIIYKSEDGGFTWKIIMNDSGYNPIFNGIYFKDENNGWGVGRNLSVFRTNDGGKNWTKVNIPSTVNSGKELYKVAFRGNNGIIVGQKRSAWTTQDNGETWYCENTNDMSNGDFTDVAFYDVNKAIVVGKNNDLYEVYFDGTISPPDLVLSPEIIEFNPSASTKTAFIYTTEKWSVETDEDWLRVEQTDYNQIQITAIPNIGPSRIGSITVIAGNDGNTTMKSFIVRQGSSTVLTPQPPSEPVPVNKKLSWEKVSNGISETPDGEYLLSVTAPTDSVVYIAGSKGKMYKSVNKGKSWSEVTNPVISRNIDIKSISFATADSGYCVSGRNLIRTTDGGETWRSYNNFMNGAIQSVANRYDKVVVVDTNGMTRENKDNDWTQAKIIGNFTVNRARISNYGIIYIVGDKGNFLKRIGSNTNKSYTSYITRTIPVSVKLNDVYFKDRVNGFAIGNKSKMYRTTNGGLKWVEIPGIEAGSGNIRNLNGIAFFGKNGIIVGEKGAAWTTTNGGNSWEYRKPDPQYNKKFTKVEFLDSNIAIAVGENNRVYRANFDAKDDDFINVDREVVNMDVAPSEAEMVNITASSNDWQASVSSDWIQIERIADNVFSITAEENTSYLERSAIVTVGLGNLAATVTVNQAGKTVTMASWERMIIGVTRKRGGKQDDLLTVDCPPDRIIVGGTNSRIMESIILPSNKAEVWREAIDNKFTNIVVNNKVPDINDIAYNEDGNGYYAGSTGHIMKATKEFDNEILSSVPARNKTFAVDVFKDTVIVSAYKDGRIDTCFLMRSTDGGNSWSINSSGHLRYTEISCIHFVNEKLVFAGGNFCSIFKSEDAGVTWTSVKNGPGSPADYITDICFTDPKNGWATSDRGVFRTTDGGANWVQQGLFFENENPIKTRGVAFYGNAGVIVGNGGNTWVTISKGNYWINLQAEIDYWRQINDVEFIDYQTAIAVGQDLRIFRLNLTNFAPPPALTVAPEVIYLTSYGTPQKATVTSDATVSIYSDSEWLSATINSNNEIFLRATTNIGIPRKGIITIIADNGENSTVKYLPVYQAGGADAFAISPEVLHFDATPETPQDVNLYTNSDWTVSENYDWINVTPIEGRNDGTITVTLEPNIGPERTATITINSLNRTKTLTITQEAGSISLEVNPTNIELESNQEVAKEIVVACNTDWRVTASETWVRISPTTGTFNARKFFITADENSFSPEARNCTVYVTAGYGDQAVTKEITVTQAGGNIEPNLVVDRETVNFEANPAENQVLNITSNVPWTAAEEIEWLSAEKEGVYNGTLTLTADVNNTPEERRGEITISGGGVTKTITIIQAALPELYVDKDEVEFEATPEGAMNIEITTNRAWTVSEDLDWLTIEPMSGTGEATLTLTATENSAYTPRNGTFTITAEDIVKTVNVKQKPRIVTLTVTPEIVNIEAVPNGNVNITINSNTNWTVTENIEWIAITPMSGNNNGTISIAPYDNTLTTERTATFTVTAGNVVKTIKIIQAGGEISLSVFPNSVHFPAIPDESKKVSLGSNYTWSITEDIDWLKVSPMNGTYSQELTLTAVPNNSIEQRTGIITVTAGDVVKSITVAQAGFNSPTPELAVSPEVITFNAIPDGDMEVSITSNTAWGVKEGIDWLTITPMNGTNNATLKLTATHNTVTSERRGTVLVTAGDITKTITVVQSATKTPEPELSISPEAVELTATPTAPQQIIVTSNTVWLVKEELEWLSVSAQGGINDGIFSIIATANKEPIKRTGKVMITAGNLVKTISVTQAAADGPKPTLSVSQSLVALGAVERRTQTIEVTSNTKWRIQDLSDTWIKVTPLNGNDKINKFEIEAEKNMGEKSRATSIKVIAGSLSKNIYVSQSGYSDNNASLTIIPGELRLPARKGSELLQVKSNQNWTAEEEDEWVTLDKNEGESEEDVRVSFTENKSTEERVAIIVFKSGNLVESVKITQKGKEDEPIFDVNPEYISLEYKENTTADITIKSNQEWNVSVDAEWVTLSPKNGKNNGTIKITAQKNTAPVARVAMITLKAGNITKNVHVNQLGFEASVTIKPENLEFTHEKDEKEVAVKSNTKWTITSDKDWIKLSKNSGENDGNFIVQVSENPDSDERSGNVTVSYGQGQEKVVKIRQTANPSRVALANDETIIYPNPAEDMLHIKHPEIITSIKVIDARGLEVLSVTKYNANRLQIKELTAGAYTIVIEDIQGRKITKKIVKL